MERKIGEIFYDINDEKIICVEADDDLCLDKKSNPCKYVSRDCIEADNFSNESCVIRGACSKSGRSDNTNVIFLNAE